jgi:hypothetical protein
VGRIIRLSSVLILLLVVGCGKTLTGVYVQPKLMPVELDPSSNPTRTIYIIAQVDLNDTANPDEDACEDWASESTSDDSDARKCRAWLADLSLSLGTSLQRRLMRDRNGTRVQLLDPDDKTWRSLAKPGDLSIKVTFKDSLIRDFTYAFLLAWRSDTYRMEATVSVEDARTGRHLRTFDVKKRYDCGLNYLWFVDVIIPLFPLYISNNKNDRAKVLSGLLGDVSSGIAKTEARIASPTMPVTVPVITPPVNTRPQAAKPDLKCIESKIYVNSATFKGFPATFFGGATQDDMGAVLASKLQSSFIEHGMRDVFTLTNLEQQLKKEKRKEILGCTANACVNRIIENFGLSESVFITVTRMGEGQAYLNLTWMDIGSETILSQQTGITKPDIESILKSVGKLSLQLLQGRCP